LRSDLVFVVFEGDEHDWAEVACRMGWDAEGVVMY
jgi:hypothetical protein